ncbi:MAG TPA: sulfite exporter TauE/SafE family protein [Methylocella sp.]|nr:sulfite exporter TauE/SafE family protein [Methylocella sp.]
MIILFVATASFAAGFINAVAGGGSFLTFPALIAAGLPAINANASNTVALFPGQIATGYMARDGLAAAAADHRVNVPMLAAISLAGGFLGGLLLLVTSQALFSKIVPWLLLFATAVFAAGNFMPIGGSRYRLNRPMMLLTQGVLAIYGGYFGGGAGILMLSALTLYGLRDLWLMNSLKILLVMLMNAAAVVAFVAAGIVHWPMTLLVASCSMIGGLTGLRAVRRVPAPVVKGFVVTTGLALTVYFFMKPA